MANEHNAVGEPKSNPTPNAVAVKPNVVWTPVDGRGGLSWSGSGGKKLIVHTTETTGLPSYPYPPHVTVDLLNPDTIWQHVSGDRGAYAMKSANPSPNYQMGPTWQVEHIAYAKDTVNAPDLFYESLAREVVWFHRNKGVPLVYAPVWEDGSAYGDWSGRMGADEFTEFAGVCGHQHVYANDHWDPGRLDVTKLRDFVDRQMDNEPDDGRDEDMMLVEGASGNAVKSLQRAMNNYAKANNKGFKVEVDGTWGKGGEMTGHLKDFQKSLNLTATGDLDGLTASYLVGRYDPPKL